MTSDANAVQARPGALTVYVRSVVVCGAAVLALSLRSVAHTPNPFEWLVFAGFAILTGYFTMKISAARAIVSVTDTFFIASTLLFGPGPATLSLAVDSFVVSVRRRNSWMRVAFNTGQCSISLWLAGQAFFAIARIPPLAQQFAPIRVLFIPLLVLTVIYFLLNSGLTAVAIGLDMRQAPAQIWYRHFRWLSVSYFAAGSAALCLILLVHQTGLWALAVILPLVIVLHLTLRATFGRLEDAHQHLANMDRLYLSTIETLAMAIDAKDDVTHSHVRRVETYAIELAKRLGIEDEATIKAIKAAALLHDTGKLAVPEHILNKPGGLTASEFEKMKLHVDVGADILSLVEFPYPVVPIVRCHHESWDGSGYPRGVRGEDIPIGARILSVVDCYDALTSDRPYRAALTDEAAVDILRSRRGTMYDPRVVDAFIAIRRDIALPQVALVEQHQALQQITRSRVTAAEPAAAAPVEAAAASSEMLAFVSLARIAAGEGTTADVLALGSSLLRELVPGATAAWYILDAGHDRLTVVDAIGPAASVLRGLAVTVGERLTGWVAAHRQVMIDADAALDLASRVTASAPRLARCLSAPLVDGTTLVGVLTLYAPASIAFTEQHGRLIQMITPHVAHAVVRAEKRQPDVVPRPRDLKIVSAR